MVSMEIDDDDRKKGFFVCRIPRQNQIFIYLVYGHPPISENALTICISLPPLHRGVHAQKSMKVLTNNEVEEKKTE